MNHYRIYRYTADDEVFPHRVELLFACGYAAAIGYIYRYLQLPVCCWCRYIIRYMTFVVGQNDHVHAGDQTN